MLPHEFDAGAGLFTPEEQAFRSSLRAWLAEHPPPEVHRDGLQLDMLAAHVAWERQLHAAGFGGLHWPVEYGGQARSLTYQLILAEELARSRVMPFRHRPTIVGMFMAGPFIIAAGSEHQRERFLPRILALDELWCQLFSEPDAGSDLASLRTAATPVAGGFVVRGQKIWNSYAHIADRGVLLARTDPTAPKHRGLTCFLLDMKLPGITVRPLRQINGGTEFNEVFFDDVMVPSEAVIGGVGNGWASVVTFLSNERSALQLGSYAEMLVEMIDLVARLGDRTVPAVERDGVVSAWMSLVLQRWTALGVASQSERGGGLDARSSLGKLQWATNLQRLSQARVAALGAGATAWEDGDGEARLVVHSLLSSRSASIAGGTSEIQRNLLGERVLQLPRG